MREKWFRLCVLYARPEVVDFSLTTSSDKFRHQPPKSTPYSIKILHSGYSVDIRHDLFLHYCFAFQASTEFRRPPKSLPINFRTNIIFAPEFLPRLCKRKGNEASRVPPVPSGWGTDGSNGRPRSLAVQNHLLVTRDQALGPSSASHSTRYMIQ